jgi:DNA-binding winged helix-turn-helix (wHTH) protein
VDDAATIRLARPQVFEVALIFRWEFPDLAGGSWTAAGTCLGPRLIYTFDDHALDSERRELRRGGAIVDIEPQVFDLLEYLIDNRERVVSKDDLLAAIWNGRVVSESTLSSRIAALRRAVGDTGERQGVIRTIARKGFRFVGDVHETGATAVPAGVPAAPRAPDIHETPNRRQLTIMACRITGALTDSSPPDPEELRDAIAEYRAAVAAAVAPHGGRIGANAADGILVHFGYPGAHEDDAERAVRAGLAVIGAMQTGAHAAPREAHIGIATGLVVVEEPHPNGGLEVSGPPLHQALRLMEAAGAGQLAIADGTRKLVGKLFECRALDRANDAGTTVAANTEAGTDGAGIKGDGRADAAWRVVRETAIANRFEALRARNAPLIGREEELAMLHRRWDHAKTGDGRAVLIWGEAGIGKSRLVAALCDALRCEPHACLRYDCSPHRMQTALHPVVAQLEDAAGFAAADSAEQKLDKLARVLEQSSPDNAHDLALFAELLSISCDTRLPALALSAQRRKELLLERFIAQIAGKAGSTPVLMILEDAHWIDPTTRELFDAVIERVRGMRVLLIMTYRPEFSPSWLGQAHVTALTLNRLGPRENAALVRNIAGGKALPPAVLAQIMTRSDGVPLFSEEVTKSVLESGIVREAAGEYVLAEPLQAQAVPATLQASLFARIDRLAHLRPLVQTSAAIGREFGYRLLRAACALSDAELMPLLDELVGSGLVHQRGLPPHATYAFKHALVQDAAYETMLKGQRIETHRRIVEVLKLDFPEFAERQADVLAHHCTEANLWEEAIGFSIAAARTALERSAGIEAQSHVQRALALLPRVPTSQARMLLEGRLRVALADALIMTEGFASPGVMTALTRARELLREEDDPEVSLRALCGLFNFHLIRSESPACLALAARCSSAGSSARPPT